MSIPGSKQTKNSGANLRVSLILAVLTLILLIYFYLPSSESPPEKLAPIRTLPIGEQAPKAKQPAAVRSLPKLQENSPEDDVPSAAMPSPPPVVSPPQIPPELQEQFRRAPEELPADLKAQLEGPPPEVPEDIKRALMTPPRVVSIEEVNDPNFRRPEEKAEPTPIPKPNGQLVDVVPSPIPTN